MTAVDVYVSDNAVVPNFISGAVVSIHNPSTFAILAQTTTDGTGRAAFTLVDATYEVRVFKSGYASPVAQIVVDIGATTNKFDIEIEDLTTLPTAIDPRLCRCTGKFVNFGNQGRPRVVFRVMAKAEFQVPKVVDGSLVYEQSMAFQSDEDGYVSIDLLRSGEYYVTFAGEDDLVWPIKVPDEPAVNLIELIHPTPLSQVWDPTDAPLNALTVQVGETKTVLSTLNFSNYEALTEGQDKWITFMNSNGSLMDLGFLSSTGEIVVKGLAPGSAQVTVELLPDLLPNRVPPPSLTTTPLDVTVVP